VDSNVSAWTFGGSILTFAFPMLLFIVVAGALYVLYTKPESIPGHRAPGLLRSVTYTAMPGKAAMEREAQALAAAEAARARPAAAGTAGIVTGATAPTPAAETPAAETLAGETPAAETGADPAAGTEDAE
jgi:hypothetical protein